jgi:hypothetical protein
MPEAGEESTPHWFHTRPHYWPRSTAILLECGLRLAPPQCPKLSLTLILAAGA